VTGGNPTAVEAPDFSRGSELYQATIIDRRLTASWQFKFNTASMLPILLGEWGGSPVRKLIRGKIN